MERVPCWRKQSKPRLAERVAPVEGALTDTDTVIEAKTMEAVSRALSPAG
jgi:hypothetical protein